MVSAKVIPMVNAFRRRMLMGCLALLSLSARGGDAFWQAVRLEAESVFPDAVVVADQPLAHTTQMFPVRGGVLVGGRDVTRQCAQVLENLDFALATAQSSRSRVVRLNVKVANAADAPAVQQWIAAQFPAAQRPAVVVAPSELPVPGGLVAMDAVAGSDVWAPAGQVNHYRVLGFGGGAAVSQVAVLPAGRKVYVSGQAVRAETLRESTRETLKSLGATLEYLRLGRQHVVQVKVFVQPMARVGEFEQSLVEFFADATVPPLVLVSWTNASPVEIELVASLPGTAPSSAADVEFVTPPHLSASTAFSRVALVQRGRLFFTSGFVGAAGQDAPTQVRESFVRLRGLVQRLNGSMALLAKTTYYAAGEDAVKALRDVRGDYLDPKRPPASSLVNVRTVATPGTGFLMDIIGVVP
jgi:enamine deaminase RidA (YjgF/YER057c/UK114 family)